MSTDLSSTLPASWSPLTYRRLRCALDVEVTAGLMRDSARSFNISGGGIYVEGERPLIPGQTVHIELEIDDQPLRLRARVVHVRPLAGFGAEFIDLEHEKRRLIIRFVHRNHATVEAQRIVGTETQELLDLGA